MKHLTLILLALLSTPRLMAHSFHDMTLPPEGLHLHLTASGSYRSDALVKSNERWTIPGVMMGGEAFPSPAGLALDDAFLSPIYRQGGTYAYLKFGKHIGGEELELDHAMLGHQWSPRIKNLDPATVRRALVSGSLLVMGNALVCFAEQWISSGMAAVMVGSVPIWVMLFNWGFFGGGRPSPLHVLGISCSLLGVVLLSQNEVQGAEGSWSGTLAVILAVIVWSMGTLAQKKARTEGRLIRYSAVQLGLGALTALMVGILQGEHQRFNFSAIATSSWLAFFYMVIFGSAIAFSSYLWLNQNVEPSKVSTYAVVNPLVAVWLGWLILDEPLTLLTVFCTALILFGIGLVVTPRRRQPPKPAEAHQHSG